MTPDVLYSQRVAEVTKAGAALRIAVEAALYAEIQMYEAAVVAMTAEGAPPKKIKDANDRGHYLRQNVSEIMRTAGRLFDTNWRKRTWGF